jgi:RimJ/RimL family protein N-acetyltransferase
VLTTERLVLSPLELEDAEFVLELVNSPGWLKYIGDRDIHDQHAAEEYIKTGPWKMSEQFGFSLLRVALKDSGTPIGMCGFLQRDFLDHPDIGFAFLPEYEGHGYAFESCTKVLDHFSNKLDLDTILAMTHPANKRSQALLARLGFKFTKQFPVKNGSLSNLYTFSTR